MTKRAYLTPRETRDMMAEQDRLCLMCMAPIGVWFDEPKIPFIAEHTCPVALGNTDKPDCLLCVPCAKRKTHGTKATTAGSDIANIAKAKRLANGGRKRKGPAMKSRGFSKTHRKRMNGKVERND